MWLASVSKFLNSSYPSNVQELAGTLLDLLEEGSYRAGGLECVYVCCRCVSTPETHPADPGSLREADGPVTPQFPALLQESLERCLCLLADTLVGGLCPAVTGRCM